MHQNKNKKQKTKTKKQKKQKKKQKKQKKQKKNNPNKKQKTNQFKHISPSYNPPKETRTRTVKERGRRRRKINEIAN